MKVGRSKYGLGVSGVLFCKGSIRLLRYSDADLLCNFNLPCPRTEFRITEGNYVSLTL